MSVDPGDGAAVKSLVFAPGTLHVRPSGGTWNEWTPMGRVVDDAIDWRPHREVVDLDEVPAGFQRTTITFRSLPITREALAAILGEDLLREPWWKRALRWRPWRR